MPARNAEAIALIVAGSGEASDKEVFDLLNDKYDGEDVTLVVPVDKNHFSKAVESAAEWFTSDDSVDPKKDVMTIQVDGANMSRKSSALGENPEEVGALQEIFGDPFDGFDRVDFVIALPDPPTDDAEDDLLREYDEHVDWVEAALGAKREIQVFNLCRGLDDVVLTDPEEPDVEPEPEPEPEKPARKPRARKEAPKVMADDVDEDTPEGAAVIDVVEEKPARKPRASRAKAKEPEAEVTATLFVEPIIADLSKVHAYLKLTDEAAALFVDEAPKERLLTSLVRNAISSLTAFAEGEAGLGTTPGPEAVEPAQEEASEAPKRGRGRPRENFEQREHYDEDTEQWVKPGKGKPRKGTKWRLIDTRDNSVLDEGTA